MTKVTGGIVMGIQIKAARSLLGWSQHELANAARVHPNAVAYWGQAVAIPTGRHQPHACRKIAQALHRSGVEFVGHAKPGVRLLRNHNFVMRPPSRARARHGLIPVISDRGEWPPNTQRHAPQLNATRMASGAKTRANGSCRAKAMANHRRRNRAATDQTNRG